MVTLNLSPACGVSTSVSTCTHHTCTHHTCTHHTCTHHTCTHHTFTHHTCTHHTSCTHVHWSMSNMCTCSLYDHTAVQEDSFHAAVSSCFRVVTESLKVEIPYQKYAQHCVQLSKTSSNGTSPHPNPSNLPLGLSSVLVPPSTILSHFQLFP